MTKTNKLVKASILSAIAAAIMYFDFMIGFGPFLKFDFSDIPAVIGAFALGPLWGVVIELVKNLVHALLKGTDTAYVGQLANFIVGAAFVLPAGYIYKLRKSKSGAIWGMLAGLFSMIVFALLANYYILIPFYVNGIGMPLPAILKLINNPAVTDLFTYLLFTALPFNFIKAAAIFIITLLLYKRISPMLHK